MNTTIKLPVRFLLASMLFASLAAQSSYYVGIIGFATYTLHQGTTFVSLVVLLLNVTSALGSIYGGVIVDRLGPQKTLRYTFPLQIISAILVQILPANEMLVLFESVVFGFLSGITECAFTSYPAYLTKDDKTLSKLNGQIEIARDVAVLVAPLISSFIIKVFPIPRVFVFYAFTSIIAFICIARVRVAIHDHMTGATDIAYDDESTSHYVKRIFTEAAEGFHIAFHSRFLTLLFLIGIAATLCYSAFDNLEFIYYRDVLRVSPEWMGYLTAIMGLGCTIGAFIASRINAKHIHLKSVIILEFFEALTSLLYVATPYIACACIGIFLCGITMGMLMPFRSTLIQKSCSLTHVGRITALIRMSSYLAGILPPMIAPILAAILGVQPTLVWACIFAIGFSLCFAGYAYYCRLQGNPIREHE